MLLSPYTSYLSETLAIWIATANPAGVPEIARATGIIVSPEFDELTVMVPQKFCNLSLANLEKNKSISFFAAHIFTYQSFQFKGVYLGARLCTSDEAMLQQEYIHAFAGMLATIGYDRQSYYNAYYHQPSVALSIRVKEIYDQTPKKGTGNLITAST